MILACASSCGQRFAAKSARDSISLARPPGGADRVARPFRPGGERTANPASRRQRRVCWHEGFGGARAGREGSRLEHARDVVWSSHLYPAGGAGSGEDGEAAPGQGSRPLGSQQPARRRLNEQ